MCNVLMHAETILNVNISLKLLKLLDNFSCKSQTSIFTLYSPCIMITYRRFKTQHMHSKNTVHMLGFKPSICSPISSCIKICPVVLQPNVSMYIYAGHSYSRYYPVIQDTTQLFKILHSYSRYYTVIHDTIQLFKILHSYSRYYTVIQKCYTVADIYLFQLAF